MLPSTCPQVHRIHDLMQRCCSPSLSAPHHSEQQQQQAQKKQELGEREAALREIYRKEGQQRGIAEELSLLVQEMLLIL